MYQGFGERVRSYQEIVDLFNAAHSDRNPISISVQKTVTYFLETETVKDRLRSGRPKSANDNKNLDVLQSFQKTPFIRVKSSASLRYQSK